MMVELANEIKEAGVILISDNIYTVFKRKVKVSGLVKVLGAFLIMNHKRINFLILLPYIQLFRFVLVSLLYNLSCRFFFFNYFL